MTVAIKESLTRLNSSLVTLEKKAVEVQERNARQQVAKKTSPDLFAVSGTATAEADIDSQALASRLDNAIERVEQLLEEGA